MEDGILIFKEEVVEFILGQDRHVIHGGFRLLDRLGQVQRPLVVEVFGDEDTLVPFFNEIWSKGLFMSSCHERRLLS